MSGMDRLTDEALITGWDNLKDNLPSDGHDAAEALFDYGDKLADALSRRASQAAPTEGEAQPLDDTTRAVLDRAERIVAGQSQQEQRTAEIFLRPTEGEA